MNSLIKDKRLKLITSLVSSKTVADIGTDHGKVIAQLFLDKKIDYAYLSDISEQSLEKAKTLLKELGFDNKAKYIVCDGLLGYDNIDGFDVVIAGMGGEEIIKILSSYKNISKANSYVLQPQKNVVKLRKYLVKNHFKIIVDKMVRQGKQYYSVIKVVYGKDRLNRKELFFGRTNVKEYGEDFVGFLNNQKDQYESIFAEAKTLSPDKKKYYKLLCKVIKKGERVC